MDRMWPDHRKTLPRWQGAPYAREDADLGLT
jgi:hypothetical protein